MDLNVRIFFAAIIYLSFYFVVDNVPVTGTRENEERKLFIYKLADDVDRHAPSFEHGKTSCIAIFKGIDGQWEHGKKVECVLWPPLKYHEILGRIRRRQRRRENDKERRNAGNSLLNTLLEIIGTGTDNGNNESKAYRIGLWTMYWIILYTICLVVLQKVLEFWKSKMTTKWPNNQRKETVLPSCLALPSQNVTSRINESTEVLAVADKDDKRLTRPINGVTVKDCDASSATNTSGKESNETCRDILPLQQMKLTPSEGQTILREQPENTGNKNSDLDYPSDLNYPSDVGTLFDASEPLSVIDITKKTCDEIEHGTEVNLNYSTDVINAEVIEGNTFSQSEMYLFNVSHFERFYGPSKLIDCEGRYIKEHQNELRDGQWKVIKRVLDDIKIERNMGLKVGEEMVGEKEIITADGDLSGLGFKVLKRCNCCNENQESPENACNVSDEEQLNNRTTKEIYSYNVNLMVDKAVPTLSSRSDSLTQHVVEKADILECVAKSDDLKDLERVRNIPDDAKFDTNIPIRQPVTNSDSAEEILVSCDKVIADYDNDLQGNAGKHDMDNQGMRKSNESGLHELENLCIIPNDRSERQMELIQAGNTGTELLFHSEERSHPLSDNGKWPLDDEEENDKHISRMMCRSNEDKLVSNDAQEPNKLNGNQSLEFPGLLKLKDTEGLKTESSLSACGEHVVIVDESIETQHQEKEKELNKRQAASRFEEKNSIMFGCDKGDEISLADNLSITIREKCFESSDKDQLQNNGDEVSLISTCDDQDEVVSFTYKDQVMENDKESISSAKHITREKAKAKPNEECSLSSADVGYDKVDNDKSNVNLKSDGECVNLIASGTQNDEESRMPTSKLQELSSGSLKENKEIETVDEFDESYCTTLLHTFCAEMLPNYDPQLLMDAYNKFEKLMEEENGYDALVQNNVAIFRPYGCVSKTVSKHHKDKDEALKDTDLFLPDTSLPSLLIDLPCYGIIPARRIDPLKAMKFWMSSLN